MSTTSGSTSPAAGGPSAPEARGDRLGAWLASHKWRLVGAALLIPMYVLIVIIALNGGSPQLQIIVVIPVLILLIVGGARLTEWMGAQRKGPQFYRPDLEDEKPSGS